MEWKFFPLLLMIEREVFKFFFFFWFTVFVGVKSEIRVRMFVEWEIVFGWLETCVEREEKEGNLGF